jgi:hypothetical protein
MTRCRGEDRRALRRMTDWLDAMTVGIQHEGAVIVSVIMRPKPRHAIVWPAGGQAPPRERRLISHSPEITSRPKPMLMRMRGSSLPMNMATKKPTVARRRAPPTLRRSSRPETRHAE